MIARYSRENSIITLARSRDSESSHVLATVNTALRRGRRSPGLPSAQSFLEVQRAAGCPLLDFQNWILWDFVKNGETVNKSLKMRLTHCDRASQDQSLDGPQLAPYDRPEVARILLSPEIPFIWFQSDESSACHAARTTLLRSLVFECSDQFHRWSMVVGGNLAIQANSCPFTFDRESPFLA